MLFRKNKEGFWKPRFPDLPQILPAKVAAAEFALILAMVAGAIVATALQVTVIDATVKPFAGGIAELFVPHGAERHAPKVVHLAALVCLLVTQNGVVFFAPDVGALKPDELVVFRVFNDHLTKQIVYTICIYMIFIFHNKINVNYV
jgi:Flp pilus assembly pilin Flp